MVDKNAINVIIIRDYACTYIRDIVKEYVFQVSRKTDAHSTRKGSITFDPFVNAFSTKGIRGGPV